MKKIGIPITRFFESGALRAELFLSLPVNNKFLRIAWAGDPADSDQIQRLAKNGVKELHLAWEEALGSDPLTYPLFQNQETNGVALSPALRLVESNPSKLPIEANKQEESVFSRTTDPQHQTEIKGSLGVEEEEQRFSQKNENQESETLIRGSKGEGEHITRVRGGTEEDTDQDFLVKGGAPPKAAASFRVISGAGGKDAPEPTIFKMERKLEDLKETIIYGGSLSLKDHREDLLKQAEGSIVTAKLSERIVAAAADETTSGEAKQETMDRLSETLEGAERGEELDEQLKTELGVKKELEAFASILDSADGDSDKLEKVSEKISALSEKREQADAAIQEQEIEKLSGPQRKPDRTFAISRIGAYLGASLGYRNADFLADLAVACVFHLAKKEGKTIEPDWMPDLTKLVLASPGISSSTEDLQRSTTQEEVMAILSAVDAYVSLPEFDIRETEPQKARWENALSTLNKNVTEAGSLADFTLQKIWTDSLSQPLSFDTTSLCSRSASRAVQWIKSTPL
jgi:hypothetical protein